MSTRTQERVESETDLLTIRPYHPEDEAGLLHVWNTTMWADPISEATWRSVYLTDPNFRRGLCVVALAGDCIVGFVLAFGTVDVASRPAMAARDAWVVGFGTSHGHRRLRIATRMFERMEREVFSCGPSRILIGPYVPSYVTPGVDIDAYPDAVQFLAKWGASTLSSSLSMKVSLTGYRSRTAGIKGAADNARDGIIVREALSSDILPCIEFVRSEFPHWIPDVTLVASQIYGGDPRTVSLFVALDDDHVIGFAMSRSERFGPFGVQEKTRGRGIGSALLSATLTSMRAKGFHCAWFLWTNDQAARLYQTHGFEEVRRFALMAKDIPG